MRVRSDDASLHGGISISKIAYAVLNWRPPTAFPSRRRGAGSGKQSGTLSEQDVPCFAISRGIRQARRVSYSCEPWERHLE